MTQKRKRGLPELRVVVACCLKRARGWTLPRNWSYSDWFEEMTAVAQAAAWEAYCDYDPSFGVPLSAFIYLRVGACLLTRSRTTLLWKGWAS